MIAFTATADIHSDYRASGKGKQARGETAETAAGPGRWPTVATAAAPDRDLQRPRHMPRHHERLRGAGEREQERHWVGHQTGPQITATEPCAP